VVPTRRRPWRSAPCTPHRDDPVAALANLAQAVVAAAQGRLAAAGQWALNEKGIIERAGLDDVRSVLVGADPRTAAAALAERVDLPAWR
jgi:hypothetical protein